MLVDERDPGTQPARALLPGARHPGRQPHPLRRAPRHLQADALRRARRRRRRRATSTTRPTSTTARWRRTSPASTPSSPGPSAPGSPASWSRRRRATPSPTSCPSTWPRSRARKLALIAKTEAAVKDRLTKEITYWDHRAEELKLQEQAGKPNARLNSGEARKRADDLQGAAAEAAGGAEARSARSRRCRRSCSAALLVVPVGLLAGHDRASPRQTPTRPVDTQASAARARAIVMDDRAQPRLRADRPRVREARLRHREPRPRHRQAALHRGEGPRRRRRRRSPSPGTRSSTRSTSRTTSSSPSSSSWTTTRTASTTCASPSSASRTSA